MKEEVMQQKLDVIFELSEKMKRETQWQTRYELAAGIQRQINDILYPDDGKEVAHEKQPQCPYCGHLLDENGYYEDEYEQYTCDHCKQQFCVRIEERQETIRTFFTAPLKPLG